MMRRCWTCNTDHDLDHPCRQSMMARSRVAAGGRATDDLFDDSAPESPFGPIFTATFESDSACCGEAIVPGEDIRADGLGGWIHADDQCEAMAR